MRNLGCATSRGKFKRILHARNRFWTISEKRPVSAYGPKQIGAILKTAAANNPRAIAAVGQGLESRYQPVAIDGAHEIDADMAARLGQGILVAETVGNQRYVPGAPRACGKCPAGGSGYHTRSFPSHCVRWRA